MYSSQIKWNFIPPGLLNTAPSPSASDHGELTGLEDDDHTQYTNTTRHDTATRHTLGTVVPHDALASLTEKDHANLTNVTAGQHHSNSLDHANTNDPAAGEKAALAGTSGTPGSGNKFVTDADSRNVNARTPTTHSHAESDVTNLTTDLTDRALTSSFVNKTLTSNFTTTATTATSTNLTFTVSANEVWEIEYFGTCQCSSTGGVKYAIGAPTGATVEGFLFTSTSAITTDSYQRITDINTLTGTAAHTVATKPGQDRIRARVKISSTAGSITIQAASVTSGQTTTIFAGAVLTARKVTEV